MGSLGGVGGWEGLDMAILWQEVHSARVLVISPTMPGQYTASLALAFILSTPWCAAWSNCKISLRIVVGITILSFSINTPSNSYSWLLYLAYWRMSGSTFLMSSGNPTFNSSRTFKSVLSFAVDSFTSDQLTMFFMLLALHKETEAFNPSSITVASSSVSTAFVTREPNISSAS